MLLKFFSVASVAIHHFIFSEGPVNMATLVESSDSHILNEMPTDRSYKTVVLCLLLGIVCIFGICTIIRVWSKEIHDKDPYILTVLAVFLFGLILSVIIVWRQPENKQKLYFKAPLVPWLPFLSLFFNIYLMISLRKVTWLRFAIWMAIGMLAFWQAFMLICEFVYIFHKCIFSIKSFSSLLICENFNFV